MAADWEFTAALGMEDSTVRNYIYRGLDLRSCIQWMDQKSNNTLPIHHQFVSLILIQGKFRLERGREAAELFDARAGLGKE